MRRILINNDLFNISKRLKKINKNYFIMYNFFNSSYEIFYKNGLNNSLELVLPYKILDKRTLDFVLKTRVENKQKLFDEMESSNEKLETENQKIQIEIASYKLKEAVNYIEKKVKNLKK